MVPVTFMKYLDGTVSLIFLRKTSVWNKTAFPASTEAALIGVLMKRRSENMQQIYRRIPMPKWALVFSCKCAAYIQNTFSLKHVWRAPSASNSLNLQELLVNESKKTISKNIYQYLFFHPICHVQCKDFRGL